MKPQAFEDLHPKIVLGIAAHPDDLDFTVAGTLATFAAQGAQVYYLQLTDGGKGSDDPNLSCEAVAATRKSEQIAACNIIGGKEVFFLDHPDGELVASLDLKHEIVRYIRKIRPDVVITTDPTVIYDREWGIINHTDHRAAGEATLDAVYPLARDCHTFPELHEEGLEPHKVKTVLMTAFSNQNFFVDVTDVYQQKMAAAIAHGSQLSDPADMTKVLTEMAENAGEKVGVKYAEGFVRLDMML